MNSPPVHSKQYNLMTNNNLKPDNSTHRNQGTHPWQRASEREREREGERGRHIYIHTHIYSYIYFNLSLSLYIYFFIYAVELFSGPFFAFYVLKLVQCFVVLFLKISSSLQKQEDFQETATKQTPNKTQICVLKLVQLVAQHTWTNF